MAGCWIYVSLVVALGRWASSETGNSSGCICDVQVSTETGVACGLRRQAVSGMQYASFLGLPYARQPVGDLRFAELQPADPWSDVYYATEEGPICPQHDLLYKSLMTNKVMDEGCIHANVHIPIDALPPCKTRRSRDIQQPFQAGWRKEEQPVKSGLPILVFVHGGGFSYGSGGTDLHGPEYLVGEGVIVITFNYRLGVFGFLSLGSEVLPGNNGLRDIVTLLRWVRDNAGHFGGDPEMVTLAGQSAGATAVHLLTLSKAAKGLFQRAILMSGVGIRNFFSTSPFYAEMLKDKFLKSINITSTDPQSIYDELTKMPIAQIQAAEKNILDFTGLIGFVPVVEFQHSGVNILDKEPEILISEGRADEIPLLVGMTNSECEVFRPRFEECDIFGRFKYYSPIILSPTFIFTNTVNDTLSIAEKVKEYYLNDSADMDNFVSLTTDAYFKYPAMKLAEIMSERNTKLYLYQFTYESKKSVIKEALKLQYDGAAHIEDLTYLFKTNSILKKQGVNKADDDVRKHFTNIMVQFIKKGNPNYDANNSWSSIAKEQLRYQEINSGTFSSMKQLTSEELQMKQLFDSIFQKKIDLPVMNR